MILLINTSTSICKLSFIQDNWRYDDDWRSDRELAKSLLSYIDKKMTENGKSWPDITAIGVFEGPGSFTGLRIGLTVMNTIADAQNIPIVGARGDNWQDVVLSKLGAGQNENVVLPFYGSEANITIPRK